MFLSNKEIQTASLNQPLVGYYSESNNENISHKGKLKTVPLLVYSNKLK